MKILNNQNSFIQKVSSDNLNKNEHALKKNTTDKLSISVTNNTLTPIKNIEKPDISNILQNIANTNIVTKHIISIDRATNILLNRNNINSDNILQLKEAITKKIISDLNKQSLHKTNFNSDSKLSLISKLKNITE